ncbi:hypothetical protein F4778DRAFT_283842 [Xylariomycetidae sp. FL2044]|nr:hypothetical protein F4778DRAFT_283842 [Xylariomycetidae sp. FL2044]
MESQKYMFVNLSQDKRSKDRKIAKEIRTHVMQDIGKGRRKTRRNLKIPLTLRSSPPPIGQLRQDTTSVLSPTDSSVCNSQTGDPVIESHTPQRPVSPGLSRPFSHQSPLQMLDDVWDMDPFTLYTLALVLNTSLSSTSRSTSSSYLALSQRPQHFLFPFAPPKSRSLRDLLISPTMRDDVDRDFSRGMSICLRRYTAGLRCINTSIASTGQQVGLKTPLVTAIIGFICYNYACQDFAQAEVHFAGLRGIIELRGGLVTLPAQIRLMIMWIDITTALMRNQQPYYTLPVDLLPVLERPSLERARQMEDMTALMLSISPEMPNVVHVYRDLKRLAAWLENQSATPGLERDSLSVSLFLDPIAHRALRECAPIMTMDASHLAKAFSLAAMMIIISLRRKYDSFPGAVPTYPITITDALEDAGMNEPEFLILRLWLLTIAGILTTDWIERHNAQVRLVAEMRSAALRSWGAVMERISLMPWFGRLWEEECTTLGEEVMSKLWPSETATSGMLRDHMGYRVPGEVDHDQNRAQHE